MVDSVNEVIRIDDNVIDEAPAVSTNLDSSYIKGVAKTDKGLVIILDIVRVFSLGEQNQLNGF